MDAIEASFVVYEKQDHDAGGHARGETEYIQEAIGPIPFEVTDG